MIFQIKNEKNHQYAFIIFMRTDIEVKQPIEGIIIL